ncbi:MAG: hypothetical protein WEB09_06840 [Nitriliruptor sp.]
MRSSQGYRHTSRPTLPVIAREDRHGYDRDGRDGRDGRDPVDTPIPTEPTERAPVARSVDVPSAVATILAGDDLPVPPDGEMAELVATLRAADRLTARAVRLAGRLDARRAAAEEGMTCDGALRLHTGLVGHDVSMVLTAADILASMPAASALFARGILTWGHVRQLTVGVRRFDRTTRTALDQHLADHTPQLEAMDAERRAWALEDAIDDHRPERVLERRADQQERTEFLALQGQLDGSGSLYGQFGPENFAAIAGGLDTEADAPRALPCPGDQDGPGDAAPTRGQQLADALVRLCTGAGAAVGARVGTAVRFSVIVDADRVTDRAAGHIVAGVRGRPPRIVRRALDRFACDAALDVVVRDGTDLIAAQRYAPEITAATRRAIAARDGGCRFPGCTAPVSWCDVHHVRPRAIEHDPRAVDGDHHPHNLVLLCRRHHTTVHGRGWRQQLGPDGTYLLRRRGRAWTTLPRTAQQLPPPGYERTGPAARAGPHATPRAGPTSAPLLPF